jgi:hypothetical protein
MPTYVTSMYQSAVEWLAVENPEVRTLLADATEDTADHRFDWLGRYDNHLEDWLSKPAQV